MITHPAKSISALADPMWQDLKAFVLERSGLEYYADRDQELAAKINDRIISEGLSGVEAYLATLQCAAHGDLEFDQLVQELTVGETYFFRHQEVFEALRQTVIPEIMNRNHVRRTLRIWSAGCSIGAEPYSIAILLDRHFQDELRDWDVTIIATDINRRCLVNARRGVFHDWAMRGVEPSVIRDYFDIDGSRYELTPMIRDRVQFQYHNLAHDPFPSLLSGLHTFDLILCRNVTIYFNQALVHCCAANFHASLVPDGWMVTGPAEPNDDTYRQFRSTTLSGAVFYQRSNTIKPSIPMCSANPPVRPGLAGLAGTRDSAHRGRADTAPSIRKRPGLEPMVPRDVAPARTMEARFGIHGRADDLARRGDLRTALELVQRQLDKDRLNAAHHLSASLLYSGIGEEAAAEHSLRRAIYLDRKNAAAHYLLGLRQQAIGDMRAAVRCYHTAIGIAIGLAPEKLVLEIEPMTAAELIGLVEKQLEVAQCS
ncbi:MAG: hypothetical protein GC162_01925 [Planctomycetes bacterium]|nr:hypothetical protein [Planctomycetota bacterium]